MYKFLSSFQSLELSTILFLYLIIRTVFDVNYLKLKIKKSNPFLVYAILIITISLTFHLILFQISEFGQFDNAQFQSYIWNKIIDLLPYIIPVLFTLLIKNIYRYKTGKEKMNTRLIASILIIMTILVVYYLPQRNVINFSADKLWMYAEKREWNGNRRIDGTDESKKFLEVINKYYFIRPTRTTRSKFRSMLWVSNKNEKLSVTGTVRGRLYTFHVYIHDNSETILEINYQLYKVINQEEFAQEISSIFDRLNKQ